MNTHKELFDFCYRFAHTCKLINDGTYTSDDGKYTIEYLPKLEGKRMSMMIKPVKK